MLASSYFFSASTVFSDIIGRLPIRPDAKESPTEDWSFLKEDFPAPFDSLDDNDPELFDPACSDFSFSNNSCVTVAASSRLLYIEGSFWNTDFLEEEGVAGFVFFSSATLTSFVFFVSGLTLLTSGLTGELTFAFSVAKFRAALDVAVGVVAAGVRELVLLIVGLVAGLSAVALLSVSGGVACPEDTSGVGVILTVSV